MTEKEDIINNIKIIEADMNLLLTERKTLTLELSNNLAHYPIAGLAVAYWQSQLNLLDLVAFCNTGKYPDE